MSNRCGGYLKKKDRIVLLFLCCVKNLTILSSVLKKEVFGFIVVFSRIKSTRFPLILERYVGVVVNEQYNSTVSFPFILLILVSTLSLAWAEIVTNSKAQMKRKMVFFISDHGCGLFLIFHAKSTPH